MEYEYLSEPEEQYTVGPCLYPDTDYDYICVEYTTHANNSEYIWTFETDNFNRPVYLFVYPVVIFLTLLTNVMLSCVLMHRKMRNTTNFVLILISYSETLASLSALPVNIQIYNSENLIDSTYVGLHRNWCVAYFLLNVYISRTFHTIAIWLTTLLGFKTIVTVNSPRQMHYVRSMRTTLVEFGIIVLFSFSLHMFTLVKSPYSTEESAGVCDLNIHYVCDEVCVYVWISFALMLATPCFLMFIIALIFAKHYLKKSNINVNQGNLVERPRGVDREEETNKTTKTTVLVVCMVFLVPHLAYTLFKSLPFIHMHNNEHLVLSSIPNQIVNCLYGILLLLSSQAKFWIMLSMDKKFIGVWKQTFKGCRNARSAHAHPIEVLSSHPEYFSKKPMTEKMFESSL